MAVSVHAGVVIRERCVLGDRVIVQPNAVIGSDGFGFAPDGQRYVKIPQVGRVIVGMMSKSVPVLRRPRHPR